MILDLPDGSRLWQPNEGQQARALSIDIFEMLYGGARGGGKTECGIVWSGLPACGPSSHPDYRGLVIRENYKDLLQWIDRAKSFYSPHGGVWKAGEQHFLFPGGAKIYLGHMGDPDAFRHYQGNQYHRLNWEELTQCPDENMYVRLLGSIRSPNPAIKPAVFASANPGGPGHSWVKKRFITQSEPGKPFWCQDIKKWRVFIPARLDDNPALMLSDPGYAAMLDGIPDEHLRRAWRDGDWDILEGQYFVEWRREIHVCEPFEIPSNWERHVAIDWGYHPDPCALLFFAIGPRGHVILWRELYLNRTLGEDVAKQILKTSPRLVTAVGGSDLWAKRNSPESTADQMVAAGLYMLEKADMTPGIRTQGWMRVHEYLQRTIDGEPAFRVFSTCTRFIEDLPSMIHDPDHPQDAMKNSAIDHGPDACRYFLMSKPLPPEEKRPQPEFENDRSRRAAEWLRRINQKKRESRSSRGW